MLPGQYPLSLYRGDSAGWRFRLWTDQFKTAPADLTDVEAAAEVRDKTGGSRIMVLDCTVELPNVVVVALAPSAWSAWSSSVPRGVWDLQLTYPSGDVQTVVAGSVTVTGDVTDSVRLAGRA